MVCKRFWFVRLSQISFVTLLLGLSLSCSLRTSKSAIISSTLIKLQDIRVAEGIDKTIVELESEEPILYTSFRLSHPDRLVIEMADVSFGQYEDEIKVSKGPIRAIHLASSGALNVSRIEFELNGLARTEVRSEGLNIVVEVTRLEKISGLGKTPEVEPKHKKSFVFFGDSEQKPQSADTAKSDGTLIPLVSPPAVPPPMTAPPETSEKIKPDLNEITKKPLIEPETSLEKIPAPLLDKVQEAKIITAIRFVHGEDLQLVVTSDGKLSPDIFFVDKNKDRLVIDLPGVKSKLKQNRIPGDDFLVKQVRFGQHPKKFRIVLDLNQPLKFTWNQEQNELRLTLK